MVDFAQGIQGFGMGSQLGGQLGELFTRGKRKREFEQLLSGIAGGPPTQEQFLALQNMAGPEVATGLMSYHTAMSGLQADEAEALRGTTMFTMDMTNRIVSALREAPEDQRMPLLAQIMEPLAQDQSTHSWLRPIAGMFQTGDMSDAYLDTLNAMSMSMEKFNTIASNKTKLADRALQEEGETQREAMKNETDIKIAEIKDKDLSPTELITESKNMVSEHGGKPSDWAIFLANRDEWVGEGDALGGGYVNKATGKPLDLGDFTKNPNEAGDPFMNPTTEDDEGLLGFFGLN